MNNTIIKSRAILTITTLMILLSNISLPHAQSFDFEKLQTQAVQFTLIVDMTVEVSFGAHSAEQKTRELGTLVSEDGLVIFNGTSLSGDLGLPSLAGLSVKTVPTKVEVSTLDGQTFEGEYIGVDQYTRIGFLRINDFEKSNLQPVQFKSRAMPKVGEWLALFMLLPDFVSPPISADVGMVSSRLESPEEFALTVGFSPIQITSVLFDEKLNPIGVLGTVIDPGASGDGSGMIESMRNFSIPLLGVITPERIEKLIEDPPQKGESERGWLGVRLQALTEDIADFWNIEIEGGVIINEIIKGSPADQAGLAVADIVYEVNGEQVEVYREESVPVFSRTIAELGPGSAVELAILRPLSDHLDTLKKSVTLTVAPMVASDAPEYENEELEFEVRNLVFSDYMMFNRTEETLSGVFVSKIKQGGLAEIGGLSFGDVIQRIGETDIDSVDDVKTVMELLETEKPTEIIFFVWRGSKTMFVNIRTDW